MHAIMTAQAQTQSRASTTSSIFGFLTPSCKSSRNQDEHNQGKHTIKRAGQRTKLQSEITVNKQTSNCTNQESPKAIIRTDASNSSTIRCETSSKSKKTHCNTAFCKKAESNFVPEEKNVSSSKTQNHSQNVVRLLVLLGAKKGVSKTSAPRHRLTGSTAHG
ncbi:Uncharacterised protein [uncultured archaeon]|nr:Uncharacterised protein [uncultured archaeon]